MKKLGVAILSGVMFLNSLCLLRAQETEGEETIFLLANRYCEKKNLNHDRLIRYINSFIPMINRWADLKKIDPQSWPEIERKVNSLLAKEGMRLFTVFTVWFFGWNLAYLIWRFGSR